jgi:hypothetical protein
MRDPVSKIKQNQLEVWLKWQSACLASVWSPILQKIKKKNRVNEPPCFLGPASTTSHTLQMNVSIGLQGLPGDRPLMNLKSFYKTCASSSVSFVKILPLG